jgi:hypothetical protein
MLTGLNSVSRSNRFPIESELSQLEKVPGGRILWRLQQIPLRT